MILWSAPVLAPVAVIAMAAAGASQASFVPLIVSGALAVIAYAAAALVSMSGPTGWSWRWMLAAWVLHGLSLGLDILGAGPGARFGFAPALSFTIWLVIAAHALERHSQSMMVARRVVCVLGAAVVTLALFFPGEVRVTESRWAPLHWLLGLVSYGLVGAAVIHAWLLDRAERRMRDPQRLPADAQGRVSPVGLPLLTLERLTFRFVDTGFAVLTVALVLGAWFALAGPGWRWDHKTVFSTLGWLVMAHLVAGRHLRGWRGRRATRWIYVGAVLLLLAYIGSRFVFEVLLGRSY